MAPVKLKADRPTHDSTSDPLRTDLGAW